MRARDFMGDQQETLVQLHQGKLANKRRAKQEADREALLPVMYANVEHQSDLLDLLQKQFEIEKLQAEAAKLYSEAADEVQKTRSSMGAANDDNPEQVQRMALAAIKRKKS